MSLDPQNTLVVETTKGKIVIALRPDLAPNHVERIKTLARAGFYDGIKFHRVIDGFMAQTGCPHGTGTGGSDMPHLNQEFSAEPQYTVWGQVVEGMDNVDKIKRGEPVRDPDSIVSMKVMADA